MRPSVYYSQARTVAEMLRLALAERGWTAGDLHRALVRDDKPSRIVVWQWVAGTRGVRPKHITRLAEVLGWPDEVRLHAHTVAGRERSSDAA